MICLFQVTGFDADPIVVLHLYPPPMLAHVFRHDHDLRLRPSAASVLVCLHFQEIGRQGEMALVVANSALVGQT